MYEANSRGATVLIDFESWGSAFVVFRKPLPPRWVKSADPVSMEIQGRLALTRSSDVTLTYSDGAVRRSIPRLCRKRRRCPVRGGAIHGRSGALPEVEFSPDLRPGRNIPIREFAIPERPCTERWWTVGLKQEGQVAVLDLGRVADIARIVVNGRRRCGLEGALRADLTPYLRHRRQIEVQVVNR
ncbi:MAG: hypothetical protein U1F61_03420 [Opitutaceae bacterium]